MATHIATSALTGLAPADRPHGDRGVRGRVAVALTLLGLVALSTQAWHETVSGGGGYSVFPPVAGGRFSSVQVSDFTFDGWRPFALPVLGLVGVLLFTAAAVMWRARSRAALAVGAALAIVAAGAGSWTVVAGQQFATVSARTDALISLGVPRTALEPILGVPVGTVDGRFAGGAPAVCDFYRAASPGLGSYVYCFHDGVLALKTTGGPSL